MIGCDAEAGVESTVPPSESPDGREGLSILAFGFSADALGKAVANRTGQCLMTCPTTAVFNGLESEKKIPVGKLLRFFWRWISKKQETG